MTVRERMPVNLDSLVLADRNRDLLVREVIVSENDEGLVTPIPDQGDLDPPRSPRGKVDEIPHVHTIARLARAGTGQGASRI